MANISEAAADRDSGVASTEGSPDKNSEKESSSKMEVTSTNSGLDQNPVIPLIGGASISNDIDEEEDETLMERLWGLTEMFPASLCNIASGITNKYLPYGYWLSRQVVWVTVSSSIILFAPVMIETERYNIEKMMKEDRNRFVLGPGTAMSGLPSSPPMS